MASTAAGTGTAMVASQNTILGDFPPVSRVKRLVSADAVRMISRPVLVSPVSDIMSTLGCSTSAWPTVLPGPVTTLYTPRGRPASSNTLAISRIEIGVRLGGLGPGGQ